LALQGRFLIGPSFRELQRQAVSTDSRKSEGESPKRQPFVHICKTKPIAAREKSGRTWSKKKSVSRQKAKKTQRKNGPRNNSIGVAELTNRGAKKA